MRTPLGTTLFIATMLLMDTYIFQAVIAVSRNSSPATKNIVYVIYWSLTVITVISFLLFVFTESDFLGKKMNEI